MNNDKKILVSVVMPVYNCERYISKSIESVIGQTYTNWELIVVNDSSIDASASIAQEIAKRDSRIRVVHQVPNAGVAQARNLGILESKGEYIAFLDSDDIWDPTKIDKQLALLLQKKAQIAYASYDFIDENDVSIKKPFVVEPETNYKKMLARNEIGCSTVLVDAQMLKKHTFRKEYYHEDYVLWMELLSIPVKAVGVSEVLVHYRVISTSRSYNKRNAAKHRWIIYRKALNLSFLHSLWAFLRYAIYAIKKHYIK
jgi:glycosyltransferase involved in cell wall biosynthesis